MVQINTLLNLPEYATASDRACAVYELMQQHDNIQAARDTAEHELMALRSATSHIFAESICAARGITDADAQEDIRAAWCEDPYAAINALAGDNITASNPYGCNQYGHEWRGKHGEGWQPRGDRQRDKKKDEEEKKSKNNESIEKLSNKMQKAHYRYEEAQENLANARKNFFDVEDDIQKALKKGDKTKVDELEKERQKANENWKKKQKDVEDAVTKYREASKKYRQTYKEKSLSDALKKLAPRTDKNGQGLMPFASNKNASSSIQNVMNKYNTLREKAENKINELQKIKSDSSKNWKEKNDAYEQWSDIYNSITALNNDFANFDKYDESRKKMAEKDMAYHIKRLEEDINR